MAAARPLPAHTADGAPRVRLRPSAIARRITDHVNCAERPPAPPRDSDAAFASARAESNAHRQRARHELYPPDPARPPTI